MIQMHTSLGKTENKQCKEYKNLSMNEQHSETSVIDAGNPKQDRCNRCKILILILLACVMVWVWSYCMVSDMCGGGRQQQSMSVGKVEQQTSMEIVIGTNGQSNQSEGVDTQIDSTQLQQYYSQVQTNISILLVQTKQSTPTKDKPPGVSIIINAVQANTNTVCIPCIKSLLMQVSQRVSLIWITKTNQHTASINATVYANTNTQQHVSYEQIVISMIEQMQMQQAELEYMRSTQYVDSTYYYLIKHIPNTHRILYAHHSMGIKHINASIMQQDTAYNVLVQCAQNTDTEWMQADLSNADTRALQRCVYLYDNAYLRIITPTNLQYHNLYAFNQIMLYPVLALAQTSTIKYAHLAQLSPYTPAQTHAHPIYFQLRPLYAIAFYEYQFCFVCASTDPHTNNLQQMKKYLAQFQSAQQQLYYKIKINIILSVIYPTQADFTQLFSIISSITANNIHISIRFRLRYQHVSAPLQVYEAVHAYCSDKSVIISSRANVTPNLALIVKTVRQAQLCKDNKYLLLSNYILPNNSITNLSMLRPEEFGKSNQTKRSQYDHYYHTNMFHALVSCSFLMLELELDAYKWQETQFYQTQYSYSIPILQKAFTNYTYTENALFTMHHTRNQSIKQLTQIQGLKLRKRFAHILSRALIPIYQSALNNYGYKKNPKLIIPKILHQIWLSNKQDISPVKKALMETLIKSNPQFQHKLWKLQNITKENFPYTYEGIMKYLQLTKKYDINYKALAADLMRIQILYREGGIYLDMKVQGKKSLLPFLKFEQFFLFANPESLVNGIIGSVKGHRAFKKILEIYFNPKNLGLPNKHIYDQTGSPVLVKAYTRKQIYTQVLNLAQFAIQGDRPCIFGNFNKQPQDDQTVYEGTTSKRQKYRIFIPCKQNADKYLQLYNVLGRTYLPTASEYY